jgi:hypothetical protein
MTDLRAAARETNYGKEERPPKAFAKSRIGAL